MCLYTKYLEYLLPVNIAWIEGCFIVEKTQINKSTNTLMSGELYNDISIFITVDVTLQHYIEHVMKPQTLDMLGNGNKL